MFELIQRKRLGVLFIAFAIVISGITSYIKLPKESIPDITIPVVNIVVTHTGVDALGMEKNVTQKIENSVRSVSGIKRMTSTSSEGLSSISIEFMTHVNIRNALQDVKDKVDQIQSELPADADTPIVSEINLSEFPIMFLNLSGNDQGLLEYLADMLDDELSAIPGVLGIDIYGKRDLEIFVSLDLDRIEALGVDPIQVGQQILRESITVNNGKLYVDGNVFHVKTDGEFNSPDPILNLKIPTSAGFTYLRDLGTVDFVEKEDRTLSRLDGKPSVSLSIKKQAGSNLLGIAAQVYAIVDYFNEHRPDGVEEIAITGDQAVEIQMMLEDLENSVLTALLAVFLVTCFILGGRNTVIVSLVIPFSMLCAFAILSAMNVTLNMIVLFSLILALGMLVDNAIVVVENIYRLSTTMPLSHAVIRGVREVAVPITTSTLTTLCAFIPLLFWDGVIGDFMKYLPITLIITLSASLATAIILTPIISRIFLHPHKRVFRKPPLLKVYEKSLLWSLHHRKTVITTAFGLFVATLFLYGTFNTGMELFPAVETRNAVIKLDMSKNTDRDTTDQAVRTIEGIVEGFADVESYVSTVFQGRAQINIQFYEQELRTQSSFKTIDDIRDALPAFAMGTTEVLARQDSPTSAYDLTIEITGDDYGPMEQVFEQLVSRMERDERIVEIQDNYDKENFYLRVLPDRDMLYHHGLTTRDVSSAIDLFFKRQKVITIYDDRNEEFDIVLGVQPEYSSIPRMLAHTIPNPQGQQVALGELIAIEYSNMLYQVNRKNNQRAITIESQVRDGINAFTVQQDLDAFIRTLELPAGVYVNFAGQAEDQQETMEFLVWAFFTALFLIFTVLIFQFHSFMIPLIIGMTVIFSIMGVLLGLLIMGMPFGIVMVGIGVVSLAGIVVNNAIVLFDYILRRYEKTGDMYKSIVNAGKIRLRPVLLTATTTMMGLMPMFFAISINFTGLSIAHGTESSQWWQSMSVTIVFGLMVSTVLTLIVVPTMFYHHHLMKTAALQWIQQKRQQRESALPMATPTPRSLRKWYHRRK
ncbi:efflux RND transporter permease subunit [Desulfurispirillum indicum]|uniref:efflux RND transporter permease subunit n=1 Tax=Desulfurispirillum indicum TaxID=936456 RepID=UPI001CFB86A3|nr:efflux RND transporter permease subunit [Desulfurispirillum indicum]UCZ55729.1 efflux RND transporter permease subunit [Desulfurispirillum indicum]